MLQILQYKKTGEIIIADLPDLKLQEGGILVRNSFSLISSGTERATVELAKASILEKVNSKPEIIKQIIDNIKKDGIISTYEKIKNKLNDYQLLGYSSAGIVLESSVSEFKPGDKVACAGQAHHSELVFIPKNLAVKIPENVTLEEASFTTLGAIALQGVRQANVKIGENVVVIGLGLIGLISIQLLKANGCTVIGLDINEQNFELAKTFGCDFVALFNEDSVKFIESATNGYGADSVIITTSTKSNEPVEKAIDFSRKKGRIVIVGVSGMTIPRKGFYEKELEFTISCSYGPGRYDTNYEGKGNDYPIAYVRFTEKRNMEVILNLISQGKLSFNSLITHKFKIEEGNKAYDLLTNKGNEKYIAVLLEYNKIPSENNYLKINSKYTFKESKEIRIGFIGAGSFAQANLLPNLDRKNVELVTVATRNPVNAKIVSEKFNFKSYASDPNEIINNGGINTVFIATNHNSHGKFVVECLKAGKNVFVEKPLCISENELKEIKAIYDSYDSNKPVLMVGFNRRFSAQFNLIQDFFDNRIEPFFINYRVNAGFIPITHWIQDPEQGGRIIGEGCHFIDIFDFLIKNKPINMYATNLRSKNSQYNNDSVIITINYEDGSVATLSYLSNGDNSMQKEYCEIFSGGKSAIMDDFRFVHLFKNQKRKTIKFNGEKGHRSEIEFFLKLIKDKEKLKSDWNIWDTTLITLLVKESLKKNIVIDLR